MRKLVIQAIAMIATTFAGAASADDWRLNVGLGYGERTNPLVHADDIPVVLDVDIAWFGERFFFDNGDLGLTLVNNEAISASVVGRAASDRVFFSKFDTPYISIRGANALPDDTGTASEEVTRPPDRDYAVEVGIEVMTDIAAGTLTTAAYHDAGGTHDGWQMLAEYDTGLRIGRWYFASAAGLTYNSSSRNDYFWGVSSTEATSDLPAYEAHGGLNAHVTLGASYHFTRQLSMAASFSYERLSNGINGSPLVDTNGVVGYFGGLVYRF